MTPEIINKYTSAIELMYHIHCNDLIQSLGLIRQDPSILNYPIFLSTKAKPLSSEGGHAESITQEELFMLKEIIQSPEVIGKSNATDNFLNSSKNQLIEEGNTPLLYALSLERFSIVISLLEFITPEMLEHQNYYNLNSMHFLPYGCHDMMHPTTIPETGYYGSPTQDQGVIEHKKQQILTLAESFIRILGAANSAESTLLVCDCNPRSTLEYCLMSEDYFSEIFIIYAGMFTDEVKLNILSNIIKKNYDYDIDMLQRKMNFIMQTFTDMGTLRELKNQMYSPKYLFNRMGLRNYIHSQGDNSGYLSIDEITFIFNECIANTKNLEGLADVITNTKSRYARVNSWPENKGTPAAEKYNTDSMDMIGQFEVVLGDLLARSESLGASQQPERSSRPKMSI